MPPAAQRVSKSRGGWLALEGYAVALGQSEGTLKFKVAAIAEVKIACIWLPPPSVSVSQEVGGHQGTY
jgi:hypothetical protein